MEAKNILVTGSSGFIGNHLVSQLVSEGHNVFGIDIEPHKPYNFTKYEFFNKNIVHIGLTKFLINKNIHEVYHLAALMGGIGYIENNKYKIAKTNLEIDSHVIQACYEASVPFVFSSSACVYAKYKQNMIKTSVLKEDDAYPADPEEGYGWAKLTTEKLILYLNDHLGSHLGKIVRFHNVYGPRGAYKGGKEKSPAAMCRKAISAVDEGSIDIWGNGKQTRTYMYITDAIEGLKLMLSSDFQGPYNLGSDEIVSIDELANVAIVLSGKTLKKKHFEHAPIGVKHRSPDLSLVENDLGWTWTITLEQGMTLTYEWIENEMRSYDLLKSDLESSRNTDTINH